MTVGDKISFGIAIATALLALATFVLAIYTRKVTKENGKSIRQAERHHRENLRPYCVIEFFNTSEQLPFGPDFFPRQGRTIPVRGGREWAETRKNTITIKGTLTNKGLGPAKGVSLYLNRRYGGPDDSAVRITFPIRVANILAVGECIEIEVEIASDSDITLAKKRSQGIDLNDEQELQGLMETARDTGEVVLEYQDVFGLFLRAVHPSGPWVDTPEQIASMGGDFDRVETLVMRTDRRMVSFHEGRQSAFTETTWLLAPTRHLSST